MSTISGNITAQIALTGTINIAEKGLSFEKAMAGQAVDFAKITGPDNDTLGIIHIKELEVTGFRFLADFAFRDNVILQKLTANDVVSGGQGAFSGCSNLIEVNLNGFTGDAAMQMFYGCKKMEIIKIPKVNSIGMQTFYNCNKLASIRLENCGSIGNSAFQYCTVLHDIYLGKNSIVSLSSGAFNGSGIATDDTARIHVPADLASSYKINSNWSAYADKIVGDYA